MKKELVGNYGNFWDSDFPSKFFQPYRESRKVVDIEKGNHLGVVPPTPLEELIYTKRPEISPITTPQQPRRRRPRSTRRCLPRPAIVPTDVLFLSDAQPSGQLLYLPADPVGVTR